MYFYTVFSVQTMLYVLSFRIQFIQHHISIWLMTSSKGNNLIKFRHPFQKTYRIRSNSYIGLSNWSILNLDRQHYIIGFSWILLTVNDCLVYIKDQCLFIKIWFRTRKVYFPFFDFCKSWRFDSIVIP